MTMTSVMPFAMVNMMRDEIVADSVKEFSDIYDKKGKVHRDSNKRQ